MTLLTDRRDAPSDDARAAVGSGVLRRGSTPDRLFAASVVAVLIPVVVATVRAAQRGWRPVGDNGYFLIRSRDVLTSHHPLLGTWTSASQNTATNFNNPGPLLFDLLALPTKLGGSIGLAIGAAALNGLSLVGIALMARRRGGPVVGMAAVLVSGLLCSSMGSELLYDPWQPHSLLLPFLFGLTCTWALADGDVVALPWALGVGSLLVQTHLTYAVLVVALGMWGVIGLGRALRQARADDPDGWAARRRSLRRVLVVSAVVVGLCWLQPVVENVTASGQGNLSRLAGNMTSAEEKVGVADGTRVVADVVIVPPAWLRPSFAEALDHNTAQQDPDQIASLDASFPVAAMLLVGLGALMLAAGWTARRRRDGAALAALATAGVALGTGLVTAWLMPSGAFGISAHQFRWLWPLGAFTALALLAAVIGQVATTSHRRQVLSVALFVGILLVAASTLPTYNVRAGPVADATAGATMDEAARQMVALEDEGPLLVDTTGIRFAEPYTGPVMAELQRRGIPFYVDSEVQVRQLGEARRLGDEDVQRLLFREGDGAAAPVPGARRVVYVEGLDETEQRERDARRDAIVDHLTTSGLVTRDLDDGSLLPAERAAVPTDHDRATIERLVDSGLILRLLEDDHLVLSDEWEERLGRYQDLEDRWDFRTMGLFLAPLRADEGP